MTLLDAADLVVGDERDDALRSTFGTFQTTPSLIANHLARFLCSTSYAILPSSIRYCITIEGVRPCHQ